MNKQLTLLLRLEVIWWIVTAIVLFGILLPIQNAIIDYPFLMINSIFVIIFITFTRYIFLLKHTFLAKRQVLKMIIIVLCIPITFYLISQVHYFQTFLDEEGIESLMPDSYLKEREGIVYFLRNQMLFFGVGSVVSSIALAFRMMVSIWLFRNRGTV